MRENFIIYKYIVSLFFLLSFINSSFAQEYGLEFLGHETVIDKRTELIIGKEQALCLGKSFELGFDLKFKPKVSSYFGYVCRLIDEENRNLDMLYQADSKGKNKHFRVVFGGKEINLSKQLDSTTLYTKWNHFQVLIKDTQLTILCNGVLLGKATLPFYFDKCFKIYWGRCSNPRFVTTDALPMYIRDIKIKSDDELVHHWPLKEVSGNSPLDVIADAQAVAINPQWLLKDHFEWKLVKKLQFKGHSSFAFDEASHRIIITSDLKTFLLNTLNDSLVTKNLAAKHPKLTFGDFGVYLPKKQQLVSVRLNEQKIFHYDFASHTWGIGPNENFNLTEYWHHNKYVYPSDSAIAFIGGYGQYKYKNRIQKYSFQTNSWTDLTMKGDLIEPRYMFGMGNLDATKSLLFGGFGSKTGDQAMNPQNYYDLFEIDWKTNQVKKRYELATPTTPFSVASSLLINKEKNTFYGLVYNQLQLESSLQLIEGSLSKPEYTPISQAIPYKFMDVTSFADLYYDQKLGKLYCVTSYFEQKPSEQNEIAIYSLSFPPTNFPHHALAQASLKSNYWLAFGFMLVAVVILGIWVFKRRVAANEINTEKLVEPLIRTENAPIIEEAIVPSTESIQIESVQIESVQIESIQTESIQQVLIPVQVQEVSAIETPSQSESAKIHLFGGFKVLNSQGNDLTNMFSPLLKEMFLYLLLNSIRWNKGIESSQLNEMFWFDKSTTSARNNRSVNITKLKYIFEQLAGIQITKDTGNWKIVFDASKINIDYYEIQKLTTAKKKLSIAEANLVLAMVNQGSFLSNLEYEWLDDFKGEISNKVIDVLLAYAEDLSVEKQAEMIVEVADTILKFDSVEETAMVLKCKSLVQLGKHSLAKTSFEKFSKDYQRLYSEEYSMTYKEFLDHR